MPSAAAFVAGCQVNYSLGEKPAKGQGNGGTTTSAMMIASGTAGEGTTVQTLGGTTISTTTGTGGGSSTTAATVVLINESSSSTSSTGTSSSGSSTTGGDCTPDETQPCYTHPDSATLNHPPCQQGIQTCQGDSTWGPCEGEVVPQPEKCEQEEIDGVDYNCDGQVFCAQNILGRAYDLRLGDVVNMAVDHQGNVIVYASVQSFLLSTFSFTEKLGGASEGRVVAKFNTNGEHLWSRAFAYRSLQPVEYNNIPIAVGPDNSTVVSGAYCYNFNTGTVDFGTGSFDAIDCDIFVSKFDSAGNLLWSHASQAQGDQAAGGVAFDSVGNIWVSGAYDSSFTISDSPVFDVPPNSPAAGIAIKLSANGSYVTSKRLAVGNVTTRPYPPGVVVDQNDNFILKGIGGGEMDFGNGQAVNTGVGSNRGYIAKYSSGGQYLWHKLYSSFARNPEVDIFAVDQANNILVAGGSPGDVDFGGGNLGMGEFYVAKLGSNGQHIWSKPYGMEIPNAEQPTNIGLTYLSTDNQGNVLIAGAARGIIDWGGGKVFSPDVNAFTGKLDTNGNFVWGFDISDNDGGLTKGYGVAEDHQGNIWVLGTYASIPKGSFDFFANGPLPDAPSSGFFLGKFSP